MYAFSKVLLYFFWKRKKSSVWTFFFGKKKIKSFLLFLIHIHTWIPCERDIETFPSIKIVLEKQQVAASFKKYFIFTSFFLVVVLPPRFFLFRTQISCIIYLKFDFTIFWGHWFFCPFYLWFILAADHSRRLSVIYTCKIDVWIGLLGGFQNFNFTVTQFDFLQLSDRLLGFLKSDFKFR